MIQAQNPNYEAYESPISYDIPTPEDLHNTELINEILKKNDRYPRPEEFKHRQTALAKLDRIVKNWVREIGKSFGRPELVEDVKALITTFGSFKLGVHGPGSDIDTLCIVPEYITRQHFFKELIEILRKSKEVTKLNPVEDAFVPVIKMVFDGIEMDLLFAQVKVQIIKKDFDILDDKNLIGLDVQSQKSLNGPRVAQEILKRVPHIDNFRMTLRCIKFWAEKRGIYGNVYGYPGGVAWALLTAKICQLYPNAAPSVLLDRFFMVYSKWNWPRPVMLKPIDDFGIPGLEVWNSKKNPHDAKHLMPVITPAYPCMCSTHNISETTKNIIMTEIQRGRSISAIASVRKIEIDPKKLANKENSSKTIDNNVTNVSVVDNKKETTKNTEIDGTGDKKKDGKAATTSNEITWETLFEETDFFVRYKNYLKIEVHSQSLDEHQQRVGFVESKLRHLFTILETIQSLVVHPYPKKFEDPKNEKLKEEEKKEKENEVHDPTTNQENRFFSTFFLLGLGTKKKQENPKDPKAKGPKNVDLSGYVDRFMSQLITDKKFKKNPESSDPIIEPIKRKDIPDFVCASDKQKILMKYKKRKIPMDPLSLIEQSSSNNAPNKSDGVVKREGNQEPPKKKRIIGSGTAIPSQFNLGVKNASPVTVPKSANKQEEEEEEEEESDELLGLPNQGGLLLSKSNIKSMPSSTKPKQTPSSEKTEKTDN